jgi:DNA-binding beta-propeller fold protein YncE
VLPSHALPDASSSHCPPGVCVAAVLGDALRRVAVLGGREGMPRSLGSVFSGSVTRFLGRGVLRGVVSRVIATPRVMSSSNGVAVSRDGSTLLVSNLDGGSHAIHAFGVADGSRRAIGKRGDGPLEFHSPCQVWIAADDFMFVADWGNDRVQVLTPTLDFHGFVGVGQLLAPRGVCANANIIVVSESDAHRISVFSRATGDLLTRFGSKGSGDGQLNLPLAACFMADNRHVAVVESYNHRVSVFSVHGEFVRHAGVGVLQYPRGVACSAFDELVVADYGNSRVVVLGSSGEALRTMGPVGRGLFTGIAMHGGTIFAQAYDPAKCDVLQ